MAVVIPSPVPGPELVSAEAWQQPVVEFPPTAPGAQPVLPAPPVAGGALETVDKNAVLVQGYIPIGRLQAQLDAVRTPKERRPDQLRKASIYRIQVQRRERGPNGFVGVEWKDNGISPAFLPRTGPAGS